MAEERSRVCKECLAFEETHPTAAGLTTARMRPAPHPGPRCATHHRAEVKRRKASSAQRRDKSVYGLMPGGYEELYRIQGGHCYICQRATGASRRLSVDHDHATDKVRGLLCRPCNSLLGQIRDDLGAAWRIAAYLTDPPASRLDPKYLKEETDD